MRRLTLTARSRHVSQRSRSVFIFPQIDPRKKCIENATYQAFTIFTLISYLGKARIFYGNDVSRNRILFFIQYILLRYIWARLRTEDSRRFLRTFSLLKSKENLCLKKFSIIGMLSNPNFDNTSLIVK